MNGTQAFSLVIDKFISWGHAFVLILPNLIAALIVAILFVLLSRLVSRALRKLLHRIWKDKDAVTILISKTAALAVILLGLLTALSILDLDKPVTSLLAGVGVISIALGFAFQDIASNFMSGILISVQHPCEVGDLIKTGNFIGKVEKIALRSTTIRTFQGPLVIIPNKDILQNPLTNYTMSGHRRVEIRAKVPVDTDLEKAKATAIEAVSSMEGIQKDRDVDLHFEEFAEGITFVLWLWVDFVEERDYTAARSAAIMRIKKAFDEAGLRLADASASPDEGNAADKGKGDS